MRDRIEDTRARVEPVVRHPLIAELGNGPSEQLRVEAFAWDLAAWLAGAPRESLRALARVIVLVGGARLRDTRAICQGLPLLAIESSARATAVMWPLLRSWTEHEEDNPDEEAPDPGDDTTNGGAGADHPAEEDPGADEDVDGQVQGPEEARPGVDELADGDLEEDPDLEAMARALQETEDPLTELAEHFEAMGQPAWDGAKQSEDVVRALDQLLPEVGWGRAPGQLQATLTRRLGRLADLLSVLPSLHEIAEQLGRLEADTRRASNQEGGSEEVTGVRLGREVSRALPNELALLGDEETEDLFYLRLSEHRLVSLELSGGGLDGVGNMSRRGPVIVCIDTSGSMQGPPEAGAKALVLAVARSVIPQGRVVHLILFGGPGERTELRLRRGAGGLEDLLDFLLRGFSGGTDFDTPLLRAMELIQESELKAADVLVVTDGYAHASPDVVSCVRDAREGRGLRIWSVLLGPGAAQGVTSFSDEVWRIDPVQEAPHELLRRVQIRGQPGGQ